MKTKLQTLLTFPDDFEQEWESEGCDIISNFDRSIDYKIAKAIKGKKLFSTYPAINFFGFVWWRTGKWHCMVMQRKKHVETISSRSLRGIMRAACEKYGSD